MTNMDDLSTLLQPYLKFVRCMDTVTVDDDLASLGLDSMGAIDLLLEIEEHFNIVIPDERLVEETFATPRTLWDVISELKDQ